MDYGYLDRGLGEFSDANDMRIATYPQGTQRWVWNTDRGLMI